MNKTIENPDSIYTQQVKRIIDLVYPKEKGLGSVIEDAEQYFSKVSAYLAKLEKIQLKLHSLDENDKKFDEKEAHLHAQRKKLQQQFDEERHQRLERVETISSQLIELCEGESWEEAQHNSAKFLGTVMMLTRGPVGKFALQHQRLKPLYKAVLTLRLVDKALQNHSLSHPYLGRYTGAYERFKGNSEWLQKWRNEIALPLIKASIFQDIGLQSREAQRILKGEDGKKNQFRVLDEEERKELLRINFQKTLDYINKGLGIPNYVGNDKEERDAFVAKQTDINNFTLQVVRDAFTGKTSVGELIKIPQIYASVVLSTKPGYSRKDLPKGYMLIEQLAKKDALNKSLASAFIDIVGYFPQGFGVTFIPVNDKGEEREQYECAIVTALNPENPAEPTCRVVTRNLQYMSAGQNLTVKKQHNLYFPANHKKLMRIGRERLIEIMEQLSSRVTADAIEDLVPSYWEPFDYFQFKRYQNLWNKAR